METDEILSRLTPIFRDVLEKPDLAIGLQTTARDVENWDSLNHVSIIMQVERAFGIKFALGELQDLKNVGSLVALIRKKTSGGAR